MTSFTFTAEQLRLAPPEVRRWAVQEIAQALAAAERPSHDPSQVRAAALAACTEEEALHVFTMIRTNFVLTQVFFELARDAAPGARVPPLHPLNTADILRHTRLAQGDGLIECFNVINEAFRQVRGVAEASLFGFDGHGHVYIHEGTHLSIRRVFEELLKPTPTAPSVQAAEPPVASSAVPQFGTGEQPVRQPSAEDMAGAVRPSSGTFRVYTVPQGPADTPPTSPTPKPEASRSVPPSPQAQTTVTQPAAGAATAGKKPARPRQGKPRARPAVAPATRRTGGPKPARPRIGKRLSK